MIEGQLVTAETEATTLSVMANGIYVFEAGGQVRPYLGVGLGMAKQGFKFTIAGLSASEDDVVFAYQALVGFRFALGGAPIAIGYRYFVTADADLDGLEADY